MNGGRSRKTPNDSNCCPSSPQAGEVDSHAGVAGEQDPKGEEGKGGALGGEGEEPEDDWISAELIDGEIGFSGPGRIGPGRCAGMG